MNVWFFPRPRWQTVALLVLGVAITSGCRKRLSKEEQLENLSPEMRAALEPMHNTPSIRDGIESPRFVSADEANLWFKASVIGVVVDGQARAYPVAEMAAMDSHVVNDVIPTTAGDRRPVTVTYCDLTDCARVLTHPDAERSLGIGTLGLLNGGLALRWGDQQFEQMAEVEELEDVPFERVTWSVWRSRYPDTLVYQGSGS